MRTFAKVVHLNLNGSMCVVLSRASFGTAWTAIAKNVSATIPNESSPYAAAVAGCLLKQLPCPAQRRPRAMQPELLAAGSIAV